MIFLEKIIQNKMSNKTYRNRILAADDYQGIMEAYKIMFELGFPENPLETFNNGSSLVKRLDENLTDLKVVLTDNQMPGINGSEIIENYARNSQFKDVRFILATGDGIEMGQKALKDGAYGYLIKPTSLEEFTKMINGALK